MKPTKKYLDLGQDIKSITRTTDYIAYEMDYCIYTKFEDGNKMLLFNRSFLLTQTENWLNINSLRFLIPVSFLEYLFGSIHINPKFQEKWINAMANFRGKSHKDINHLVLRMIGHKPSFWSGSQFWYLIRRNDLSSFHSALETAIEMIGGFDVTAQKLVKIIIAEKQIPHMKFSVLGSTSFNDKADPFFVSHLTDHLVVTNMIDVILSEIIDKHPEKYGKMEVIHI